jgi:tetratricopeptide (TPR) repeat protein
MRPSRRIAAALPLALLAPAAVCAQSAEADSAELLAREARTHYDAGRFEQAVSAYLKAYRASPSAGYLYNIAVVYDRKLNESGLAIDFYRRYIVAEDADPTAVERATTRIKALKAQAPVDPLDAPPARPAPASESPPVASEADAPAPRPAAAAEGGAGRRIAAYTLLGVGGASLIGGAALGVLAYTVQGKYQAADNVADKKNLQSLGRSEALAGDILMGAGLIMAGVGTWLLLTSEADAAPEPEAGEAASAGLGLVPLPGGVGLTFGGTL